MSKITIGEIFSIAGDAISKVFTKNILLVITLLCTIEVIGGYLAFLPFSFIGVQDGDTPTTPFITTAIVTFSVVLSAGIMMALFFHTAIAFSVINKTKHTFKSYLSAILSLFKTRWKSLLLSGFLVFLILLLVFAAVFLISMGMTYLSLWLAIPVAILGGVCFVYLSYSYMFTSFAVIYDNLKATQAMKLSSKLSKGIKLKLFFSLFLISLVAFITVIIAFLIVALLIGLPLFFTLNSTSPESIGDFSIFINAIYIIFNFLGYFLRDLGTAYFVIIYANVYVKIRNSISSASAKKA